VASYAKENFPRT